MFVGATSSVDARWICLNTCDMIPDCHLEIFAVDIELIVYGALQRLCLSG